METEYLFTKDEQFRTNYCRIDGGVRYGKIIAEMDGLALDAGCKYLMDSKDAKVSVEGGVQLDFHLVTVSVDRVDFLHKLSVNKDMQMRGYVLFSSGSTVMIKIDVLERESDDDLWEEVGDALFIFVARCVETGKAYKVPDMKISPYDDIQATTKAYGIGLAIKKLSRDKSMRDLHHSLPEFEESEHYQQYLSKIEQIQKTNPSSVVEMASTIMEHRVIMHSQNVNMYGNLFGGYMMQQAFDIAMITVLKQSIEWGNGCSSPELLRVDQVLFLKPVTVGSICIFKSKVTLIEEMDKIGHVLRVVVKAYDGHRDQTNNFNFLFAVQAPTPRYILPVTFDDILEYHEAARRLLDEKISRDSGSE
jgi:acyl-coenzyme A thioesterase 9